MATNPLRFFRDEDLVIPCSHRDASDSGKAQGTTRHQTKDCGAHLLINPEEVNKTLVAFNDAAYPHVGHNVEITLDNASISSFGIKAIKKNPRILYEEFQSIPKLNVTISIENTVNFTGFSRVYLSLFTVEVKHIRMSTVLFSLTEELFIAPTVAWDPRKLHTLTTLTYPCDKQGARLKHFDVMSGSSTKSRDLSQLDADCDSITRMRYTPNGRHIVVAVLEKINANRSYLTKVFVLESDTFDVVSKSRASLVKLCHTECILNVRPQFSRCVHYVCVPGERFSKKIVHKMPTESSLKDICRCQILQYIPRQANHVDIINQLDIPKTLKGFLKFQ
jgi:hypothetical protein